MKVFAITCVMLFMVTMVMGQNRERNSKPRVQKNNDSPEEQGRTLGLLRPILSLGAGSLGSLGGALGGLGGLGGFGLGYDQPYRPTTATRPQSDYYGGGYGSYPSNGYGGYGYRPSYSGYGYRPNYYGGYGGYGSVYPQYAGYGYRPQIYPGLGGYGGGGYPSYNQYQRPGYGSSAIGSPAGGAGSVTPSPSLAGLNGAQAAEVANLLGQLLGQQLRPLINGATASDTPGVSPSSLVGGSNPYYK